MKMSKRRKSKHIKMHVVVDTSFWIDFHRGALKAAERERIESAILDGRVILPSN